MFDTEGYLFLVTHPLAITGVYASGPLTDAMPDPREAFAEELAEEVEDVPAVMQPSESVTMAAWCVCVCACRFSDVLMLKRDRNPMSCCVMSCDG